MNATRSSHRPASRVFVAALGAALVATVAAASAAVAAPSSSGRAVTDAYTVAAPPSPWARDAGFPGAGQLSWRIQPTPESSVGIAVTYMGAVETAAGPAIEDILGVAKRAIRAQFDGMRDLERSGFDPDSMRAGGLAWFGFRVSYVTPMARGVSYRWVALHPGFPARRRAYFVSYDAVGVAGKPVPDRLDDARAVARSLTPAGHGLAGGIADAWLDARAAAFSARIDSAQRLCWRRRPDNAPARQYTALGPGLGLEGDFAQASQAMPPDSTADLGAPEYGVIFDRNGDGRYDLLVLNRGVVQGAVTGLFAAVSVVGDEDFDGRPDASLLETGDADGDGKADHRLLVVDTTRDGVPDAATAFTDGLAAPDARALKIRNGLVLDRLVGAEGREILFAESWQDLARLFANFNDQRADCAR